MSARSWSIDAGESPPPPLVGGARPDTSFPVFDKTPGDDPFARDEFTLALVKLARQLLGAVEAQEYHKKLLRMASDNDNVALGSAMVPQHQNQPNLNTPVEPRPVTPSRRISRQKAFVGAWNADIFFDDRWWLNPRAESASDAGPVLERWMRSVRIIRARDSYGAIAIQEPGSLAASWRARFRVSFPDFDILQPGQDRGLSTRWPGYNA